MSDNYEDQFDWDDAVGGGLIDHYEGTVVDSQFLIDEEYNAETIQLKWTVELTRQDDPDIELEPGDTVTAEFNLGNTGSWEHSPDGKSAERIDGKRPRPHESSGYGRLLGAITKKKALGDDAATKIANTKDLVEVLRGRGSGLNAKIWEGLTFRFNRLDFSFTPRGEDEPVNYSRTYPVEYLGEGDVPTSTDDDEDSGSDVSREDLVALAGEHDEYRPFLAAAMAKFPGVESSEHGEDLLQEEGGIFSEAHAD